MIMHRESILLSVFFLMIIGIYAFAEDSAPNQQDFSVLWKQENQLGYIAHPNLGSVFSGDILVLEIKTIENKKRFILTRPVVLQEPYFETLKEPYLDDQYRAVSEIFFIKSCLKFDNEEMYEKGRLFGFMVFGTNNFVRFRPCHSIFFHWHRAWGYQAYMEESDIGFWLERESDRPASTLKLCKHQALVWDFPLIKDKYVQWDIYWESESVRDFAMSFIRGIKPSHPEIVSWRLDASIFGEDFYGWEE